MFIVLQNQKHIFIIFQIMNNLEETKENILL